MGFYDVYTNFLDVYNIKVHKLVGWFVNKRIEKFEYPLLYRLIVNSTPKGLGFILHKLFKWWITSWYVHAKGNAFWCLLNMNTQLWLKLHLVPSNCTWSHCVHLIGCVATSTMRFLESCRQGNVEGGGY